MEDQKKKRKKSEEIFEDFFKEYPGEVAGETFQILGRCLGKKLGGIHLEILREIFEWNPRMYFYRIFEKFSGRNSEEVLEGFYKEILYLNASMGEFLYQSIPD